MYNNYLENLKALAGTNNYTVTNHDLALLCTKYNLSDAEAAEMLKYCMEHGIMFSEEKEKDNSGENIEINNILVFELNEEQKEHNKLACEVADTIMHIAVEKALKEPETQFGWFCSRYFKTIRKSVTEKVRRKFSIEQLYFIIEQMSECTEEEFFKLEDQQEQDLCNVINRKLNELIPNLHATRFKEYFPDT